MLLVSKESVKKHFIIKRDGLADISCSTTQIYRLAVTVS